MEGEQMPKATINNFIKSKVSLNYSAEFISKVIYLSKQFIVRLADKSNQICMKSNKKTISLEHLESAMTSFGMHNHLKAIREVGNSLKEISILKRETSQRIQQDIQRERKAMRQDGQGLEIREQKAIQIRQKFQQIQIDSDQDQEQDYQAICNDNDQEERQSKDYKENKSGKPQKESKFEKDDKYDKENKSEKGQMKDSEQQE